MATQSTTKPSFSRRWEDYQPSKAMLVWACIAAVIATIIVGFSWGGWVTGGTSQTMAKAAGDTARGELASAICVERFNAAPDAAAKLAEFQGDTRQLQEAAVRRSRRLGDDARPDDSRQAWRPGLRHGAQRIMPA